MKNVLLIGLGRFGVHLARELYNLGHQVMLVDRNEERVQAALPYAVNAQIGDATSRDFLASLGVQNYDVCIVSIGSDFQTSLETTSTLKELGAKTVVSRAKREVQEKFLLRNGADEVVFAEKQLARWAAIRYTADHILDYMELDPTHSMVEVQVPADWCGKTVGELRIRPRFGLNVLAVKENGNLTTAITADTRLTSAMTMLVLGEDKALRKCFHM